MTITGEINGYPFSYQRKHSEHTIRLAKHENPGKWGSSIDQFKAGGIDFTIDVLAKSITELDDILAAIMTEGSGTFSPGHPYEGWHYTGVVGDLSSDLRLSQYVPERVHPLSFLFCTDLPFMLSDVVHSRGAYVDSTGSTFSIDTCFAGNLVKNFSFEEWVTSDAGNIPDSWESDDDMIKGAVMLAPNSGTYGYVIEGDGTTVKLGEIYQSIPVEIGKTYTFGCYLFSTLTLTGTSTIELVVDGVSVDSATREGPNGAWEWLTFDYTFLTQPADAKIKIYVTDTPESGGMFIFDDVLCTESGNYENSTFGNQITTLGTVVTIPDIEVEASNFGSSGPVAGASYTKYDTGNTYSSSSSSYHLDCTLTVAAVAGVSHRIDVARVKQWTQNASSTASVKLTLTNSGWNGGAEGTILEYSTTALYASMVPRDTVTYGTAAITCDENTAIVIKLYLKSSSGTYNASAKYLSVAYTEISGSGATFPEDIAVYNTADTLTKLQIANLLVPGSKIRVNADDTGAYTFIDDFSTNAYSFISTVSGTVTYSSTNKNITISDTAYLIYPFDTKFPVTGIPELVLYVNSGHPLVYIAVDSGGSPGTFYAVDNNPSADITNSTYTYLLNNATSLSLKNSTKFYIKIIPPSGATCAVSVMQLYVDLVTVDAERPFINLGSSNTFGIDMSSDAGCNVSLYYNDRKVGI